MSRKAKLSPSMSVEQFDRGYWYATELKTFAKTIGIPQSGTLRKDELETAIKRFLKTGDVPRSSPPNRPAAGAKDVDRGLSLALPVVHYTNDAETKRFLEREARKLAPGLSRKSGARYRLNRWREARLAAGLKTTYKDLVKEYVRLNQTVGAFARIPHVRYIYFLSDFMAARSATRADAIKAWHEVKRLDVPKTYRSWVKSRS
jgi:hypothetical protein